MVDDDQRNNSDGKDKEEDLEFVLCKVSGLEGEPPSEKNSPTPMVP